MRVNHLIEWFLDMDNPPGNEETDVANGQPVTIEAEYDIPGKGDVVIKQWTFHQKTPSQAKKPQYVPLEATLWRIGAWYGSSEERPEGGNEAGILSEC